MLTPAHRDALLTPRRVLERFDRRGVRISPGISLDASANTLATQPTDVGFIQAPGADELIILGPDGPPTGGYPAIACVATVDLGTVGQLRPHDTLRIEVIDVAHARTLLAALWRDVDAELRPS